MKKTPIPVLIARIFGVYFVLTFGLSLFWNGLSWFAGGGVMFPIAAVIGVSIFMTFSTVIVCWLFSTVGAEIWMGKDPSFQKWKAEGGRPYWDFIGWPINQPPKAHSSSGLAEPRYTDFVPPPHWKFQCPVCGARVQKQIDVCWNCNYGADGDSTAYYERWGGKADEPSRS